MDDPRLDAGAHSQGLRSLARSSRWLGADHAVLRTIHGVAQNAQSFLDLGCGSGSLLQRIGASIPSRIIGVDRSRFALGLAAKSQPSRNWIVADVRKLPLADRSVDVAVCTLLVHHFDPDDAVKLLSEAGRIARLAVIISDLTRSRLALICTWLFTRIFSRSWVFHVDGPRSVRAAYTRLEMQSLTVRAHLDGVIIRGQFPFRMLLIWRKLPDATVK